MSKIDASESGDDREPMSLRAAAKLASVPRAYLDELVASGRLAVHLRHTSKGSKFRVTRAELEAAGIIKRPEPREPSDEPLVRLFREQAERLAVIEEQRFQLAGQLGAALERNRLLEERLLQLAATTEPDSGFEAASRDPSPSNEPAQPGVRPETLETEPSAHAPLMPSEQTSGAQPAPKWPPRRAVTAFSRLRGVVRRTSGQ